MMANNLDKMLAYIDSEGNLRIRIRDQNTLNDLSVTFLKDGGVDLTKSFYPEDAVASFFDGDSLQVSFHDKVY